MKLSVAALFVASATAFSTSGVAPARSVAFVAGNNAAASVRYTNT